MGTENSYEALEAAETEVKKALGEASKSPEDFAAELAEARARLRKDLHDQQDQGQS